MRRVKQNDIIVIAAVMTIFDDDNDGDDFDGNDDETGNCDDRTPGDD